MDVCPWCGSYLIFLSKEKKWYCNSCHEIPKNKPFDKKAVIRRNYHKDLIRTSIYLAVIGIIATPLIFLLALLPLGLILTITIIVLLIIAVLLVLGGLGIAAANILVLRLSKQSYLSA